MKIHGHPSTHGNNVNRYSCGRFDATGHRACTGFSGDYDTYLCGCCCHDEHSDPGSLSDEDRQTIRRVRGEAS